MSISNKAFTYRRIIHYYETDAMGVVHHSNYLRLFEEARVALLRDRGLLAMQQPDQTADDLVFAVLETRCHHFKPAYFEDEVRIETQMRLDGGKLRFQYQLFTSRYDRPAATGMSLHILVDKTLKVRKLPVRVRAQLEKEEWTETWLLNS